jgi:hypothetical protein
VIALFGALAVEAQGTDPGQGSVSESGLAERIEVRMAQADISITEGDALRSVPGITLGQLDVRLDGRRVEDEVLARAKLDYVCDDAPSVSVPGSSLDDRLRALELRGVLAMVDFNYLDAAGRHRVAEAFDEIARGAVDGDDAFKIYGYTRQLRLLTPGFTRDPDELRAAASAVRGEAYRAKPATGATEFASAQGTQYTPESDIPRALPSDPFLQVSEALSAAGGGAEGGFASTGSPDAASLLQRVQGGFAALRAEISLSNDLADALSEYRPTASIAALETILRAHSGLPGRKALILFSSEAFSFADRARAEQATRALKDLARRGFTIWTVDVEGMTRQGTGVLLSSLAAETGGRSVRRTGRLATAFEGASEQLSCYYLLSVPVQSAPERTVRRSLTVRLDTDRHPELWNYRVTSPSQLIVPDRASLRREEQVAALTMPEEFDDLPVVVTLDYPVAGSGGGEVVPVRVRIPLGPLEWRDAEQGVEARVQIDAVVERDTGSGVRILRTVDRAGEGRRLEIRLPKPPRAGEETGLQVEVSAPFDRDGLYTARAVVTDLGAGVTGAARSTAWVGRRGSSAWGVHAPRVETLPASASRRDLIWSVGASDTSGRPRLERDTAGVTWRTVSRALPARAGDFVALRFVLCGPDATLAEGAFRPFVARRGVDGGLDVELWLTSGGLRLSGLPERGSFCAAAAAVVQSAELHEPGEYTFGLARRGGPQGDRPRPEDARAADRGPAPPGWIVAASVPFSLR